MTMVAMTKARALELGTGRFDTADFYNAHDSERRIAGSPGCDRNRVALSTEAALAERLGPLARRATPTNANRAP
jgi:aryl-alcohol dehydrogenase-like predicted oxidoreductase